jgi:hypothetical protein
VFGMLGGRLGFFSAWLNLLAGWACWQDVCSFLLSGLAGWMCLLAVGKAAMSRWLGFLSGWLPFLSGWLSFTLSGLGGSPSLPDRKLAGRLGLLVDWLCLLLG